MKITFISDTHTKHNKISPSLPGGDIIIHSGDIMNSGYNVEEIIDFLEWFNSLNYTHKIFIAGNHDRFIQNNSNEFQNILKNYKVNYIEDEYIVIEGLKIYGTPWQPYFHNWAFNLPRLGDELKRKYDLITRNLDILITHTPPQTILDKSGVPYNEPLLGSKLLLNKILEVKPKINVFGHIHGSYGYMNKYNTHFINASILNEQYIYTNKPITINWDKDSNFLEFI